MMNKKPHVVTNPLLHIVLDRPCIAGNIAAIVRTTVATQCVLHVCGPLVFDMADKTKWRAGLDYFRGARVHFHLSLERCLNVLNIDPWLLEVGGHLTPWQAPLAMGDVVVLGPENGSIKSEVIKAHASRVLTLPQVGPVRSLNLAQCAAVIAFEALRQQGQ
jgi:tRNA (cytidine/uridine-2'-O-)-methyltransferase